MQRDKKEVGPRALPGQVSQSNQILSHGPPARSQFLRIHFHKNLGMVSLQDATRSLQHGELRAFCVDFDEVHLFFLDTHSSQHTYKNELCHTQK